MMFPLKSHRDFIIALIYYRVYMLSVMLPNPVLLDLPGASVWRGRSEASDAARERDVQARRCQLAPRDGTGIPGS